MTAPPSHEGCVPIVYIGTGQQTGSQVFVTADGRIWSTVIVPWTDSQTGPDPRILGEVHGGRMCRVSR